MKAALLGLGYVARKHLEAMKATGVEVVAACDLRDVAGLLDGYNGNCEFYRDPVSFFGRLHKGDISTLAVCTPNDLHVEHAIAGLRAGLDVILEKPLALRHADVERLLLAEGQAVGRVYPVVQLRHERAIDELRKKLANPYGNHTGKLDYYTHRGPWYDESWKGDERRSGGILVNLGVHLFDLCGFLLGRFNDVAEVRLSRRSASGWLHYERGTVRFDLSSDRGETSRRLEIDGQAIDLVMTQNLHVAVYRCAMDGGRVSLLDAAEALRTIEMIKAKAKKQHMEDL